MKLKYVMMCLCFLAITTSTPLFADGIVVDKVYHPYVLANETEIEWRLMSRQNEDGNQLAQRLAFGHSLNERTTIELYVVGERDADDNYGLQAIEAEVRWMLTEQGQYWADWGALFEVEKQYELDSWEISTGLIFEKEFGLTSLTANALIVFEFGNDIKNELETEFRLQYRYRWIPELQPAIELYTGEDFFGIGPAFMGIHRFEGKKQIKWEAGFIAGLQGDKKDHTLRLVIEYEF